MRDALRHLALVLCALLAAYVLITGGYLLTVLGIAAIYTVLVSGLNLFMGFAGQVSFGQNAFAAIGGYASATLTTAYGWDPVLAMLAGAALAMGIAAITGWPVLRLSGHALAMATLSLGLIVYELAVQWQGLTQGYTGISGIPPLGVAGYQVTGDRAAVLVLLGFAVLSLWIAYRLRWSRFGRALHAVGGSPEAARALGIDVARYKLASFVIAAAHASVAGSLFAAYVGFISPEIFGMSMVIQAFTMLYVGGIGTIAGPFVGALVIGMLPELVHGFAAYQDLLYGVLLIVILVFSPKGLAGFDQWFRRRAAAR